MAVPGFFKFGNCAGSKSTVPPYLLTDTFLSNSCGSVRYLVFVGVAGSKCYDYTIILKQYQRKRFENFFFDKIRHFNFKYPEPDPGSGFGYKIFSIMLNADP
jgi:hypothetical protein